MSSAKQPTIKTIKVRIPQWVICPSCGLRQSFKKEKEHYKKVRDINIDHPLILRIQMVYAKCHKGCSSFALPTPGVEKYQRATIRLQKEAVASLIEDNSTTIRTSAKFERAFNTTGSRSAIDRWKHQEATQYSFKDIIAQLDFSGVLCFDEYKPKRSKTYDLIASDAIRDKILYLDAVPSLFYTPKFKAGAIARGHIEQFIFKLKDLGIVPFAVIFDLATAYPKQVRKVYPNVIIQFDYFHVIQEVQRCIRLAIINFRKQLASEGFVDEKTEIWQHKWRLLKNMDNWTIKDHRIIEELIEYYRGTIVEKALIFKEQLRDIFDTSTSKVEAYHKRHMLSKQTYWQDSYHLKQIMKFIYSWRFPFMITYLSHPNIPRAGNSESCIRLWRQMEKVRYGMTTQGRKDHLKLYQISKYLGGNLPITKI